MVGVEIPVGILTAVLISFIPIGSAFLAWVVKELANVSNTNARTAERLEHLEQRMERLESAVWRPAWGPGGGPTTSPPPTS
jgi:hypothetical protein